ncbi:MAG TPA: Pnap_2097 family protein [Pyrinomonadaceae bacterium]|jgi:probable biosynthetic protein (TIGR04098 family)|nr:Pnap_2097 family protein [Pyrinomonadaceae bacterium]
MSDTVIHLPQTDATGLSENWLFKHCGEMHWNHLCAAMGVSGVNAKEMRDDAGNRLYPTFVAIKGRYATPLSLVQMDQHFQTTVELNHFGRAFFHSTIAFSNEAARFDLEMLTTFVARYKDGLNDLHQSLPSADLQYTSRPLNSSPPLLKLSQALRHAKIRDYDFVGHRFSNPEADLNLHVSFEPSPYIDYNGAGLLYFAAYPTIADTLERQLIMKHELVEGAGDWAVRTSTVARDVFYYRNLNLGQRLTATLRRFDRVGENIILHTSLTAESDGAALADIFTAKRLLL